MDIAVLNSNQQSALQLLVISLRNIHFGTTVNIASIAYDAEYMYDLVDRMAARYETLHQFLATDRDGLDVFDYTIRYSLTHLLTHSLTRLLTHLLTYLLTHSLTYLLTYSLTYLLTLAPAIYGLYV